MVTEKNDYKKDFLESRKKYIEKQFDYLNERQLEATVQVSGPMLILAGAGSGKTTVLVNRILNLVEFGTAYVSDEIPASLTREDLNELNSLIASGNKADDRIMSLLNDGKVDPWNILAITFTNKAAGELKSRIVERVGPRGSNVFASTFHSACVRFLRRDADRIGYDKNFTIYDSDDSRRVIKQIIKDNGIDDRFITVASVASAISRAKDSMCSTVEFTQNIQNYTDELYAKIYTEYQSRLSAAGAMDFDDLIFNTVILLENNKRIRDMYHERFTYIFVDEYQDTSVAQFRLVKLLTGSHQNICVVGDDDQSIYKFRGATIKNILTFEASFPGAKVVRLEQNYRSTGNILDAANSVITYNTNRKGKTLWTANEFGAQVSVYSASSAEEETRFIVSTIEQAHDDGMSYGSNAILYRMNSQSKQYENELYLRGIPYKIFGAVRFLDRAEIKDMLAYMSIVDNPEDNLRLKRIINNPTRKIGNTTIAAVEMIALREHLSMLEVIDNREKYEEISRTSKALGEFNDIYRNLIKAHQTAKSIEAFAKQVYELSGYEAMLIEDNEEVRKDNIEMLFTAIRRFEEEFDDTSLSDFLSYISLYSDTDNYDSNEDVVVLMTLHGAKGLEFDNVFMPALEEGIFPSSQSWYNTEDIEEERRLCYVGITRARKNLYVSHAARRILFGKTMSNPRSRFLTELPQNITLTGRTVFPSVSISEPVARNLNTIATTTPKKDIEQTEYIRFEVGDEVVHRKFGRGKVISAKHLLSDSILEIVFEIHGTKKIMAATAKMQRPQ